MKGGEEKARVKKKLFKLSLSERAKAKTAGMT